jgi:hypothetical protein
MNKDHEKKKTPRTTPYSTGPRGPNTKAKEYNSSAKADTGHRSNRTAGDWLEVFDWYDRHPGISQGKVVEHFKTRSKKEGGSLTFDQSTFSKNLKRRKELEERAESAPTKGVPGRHSGTGSRLVQRALMMMVEAFW